MSLRLRRPRSQIVVVYDDGALPQQPAPSPLYQEDYFLAPVVVPYVAIRQPAPYDDVLPIAAAAVTSHLLACLGCGG